jgi:hypothetical protein
MCRLVITECGLRVRRMKKGYVKKNQQVNLVSELQWYHSYYFCVIFVSVSRNFVFDLSRCSTLNR